MTVTVYSKPSCPFCVKAKQLLESEGIDYTEVNLQEHPEQVQPLIERTNYRKVPQIFINEEFVGGFSELQSLKTSGKLNEMV